MPQYLVSFSIGPVQDFISAAWRTRDLWFGSRLLSEISKAVAGYVRMHGELIFPHSSTLSKDMEADSRFAVVNKLNDGSDFLAEEALCAPPPVEGLILRPGLPKEDEV